MIKVLPQPFKHVCEVAASMNWLLLLTIMNIPTRSDTGFQLSNGCDSEIEGATASSILSHAKAPELAIVVDFMPRLDLNITLDNIFVNNLLRAET